MKAFFTFLKTTILGGLLVIVPLVLVLLIVVEAVDLLVAVVQPVAEMLPRDWIETERQARILAFFLLLGLCFLTGLATQSRSGKGAGRWVERTVLQRLPGYGLAKTLTRQISGGGDQSRFAPAVLRAGHDTLFLAYIIEEHPNGWFTLLVPGSPVGTAGGLQYVPGERVERLKAPLGQVFNCVTSYGLGSGPLFMPYTPGQRSAGGGDDGEDTLKDGDG